MAKILAVDDDNIMAGFYNDLFSGAGYDIRTAMDAGAGLDLFYDFKPDLMVLDAEMPGGGGERIFGVARKLIRSGTPVIFVTGIPERVVDFALLEGKVRVFKKPVDAAELLLAVKELLAKR